MHHFYLLMWFAFRPPTKFNQFVCNSHPKLQFTQQQSSKIKLIVRTSKNKIPLNSMQTTIWVLPHPDNKIREHCKLQLFGKFLQVHWNKVWCARQQQQQQQPLCKSISSLKITFSLIENNCFFCYPCFIRAGRMLLLLEDISHFLPTLNCPNV